MKKSRLNRYKQKMNFIITKLGNIPDSLKTEVEINAMLYCVQVAIDGAMDIAAMLVRDLGHDVSDDYHNIDILIKEKVIAASLGEDLKRFNGLRNAIVHKYNTFEEESVVENLAKIKESLEKFLEIVEVKINGFKQENNRGS